MPLLALGHKMALSLLTLMLGSALATKPRATKRDATAMIRSLGFGLDRNAEPQPVLQCSHEEVRSHLQAFTSPSNDVASRRKMRQRGEEISGEEISGGGNTTRVLCSCVSPFVISSTVNAWRCELTSSSEVSTLSQEDSERASHSETWRPGLKGIIYLTCKNATQSSEADRQRAATVVSLARARCPVL